MKVLLDENITQKSIGVLQKYGHNRRFFEK